METNSSTVSTIIRNNAKWPIVVSSILMAITIGSFGLSELINSKGSNGDIPLKNWKSKITAKEYQEIFNQDIFYLNYGDQGRAYLERMTLQTALQLKDAENRKISVTDKEVFEKINTDKMFADDKGNFDPNKYNDTLGQMYKNQKDVASRRSVYEKKMRFELIKEKLKNEITKNVKPTDQEIKDSFHNKFDSVEYEIVNIEVDVKNAPQPSEAEIKKLYDENSKSPDYMTDKTINAKYIFFPFKKFEVEAPKEEELQNYYDKNKSEFLEPESAPKEPTATAKEPSYKSFKNVKNEIAQKLSLQKSRDKASLETDKIHTEMSAILNDKKEVDITKGFETVKPANGTFGESSFFSQKSGADELTEKFGDIKNFRDQAFATLDKTTLQRVHLEKGILFYSVNKAEIKVPVLKPLEQVKSEVVAELKEDKAWEIAGKKAQELAKTCEANTWAKTIEAQKLIAEPQKVVIGEAAGKHKGIVDTLLEKKILTGKYLVLPSAPEENKYYAVFYKDRSPATDEKFKKEKDDLFKTLDSSKKVKVWSDYTNDLPKTAGIPEPEEGDKK